MAKRESGKRKVSSDFFRKNPNVEHILYKGKGKPIKDVTLRHGSHDVMPDYTQIDKLYLQGGGEPYTLIHNHPKDRKNYVSLPSYGDLHFFLMDDGVEAIAIYQHNNKTNETEGMYVIRKTKKTPKSNIKLSSIVKGSKSMDEVEVKVAKIKNGRLYNLFDSGPSRRALEGYFQLTENPQHSNVSEEDRPKERQRLLGEAAKKLHLQVKYVPANGYEYTQGVGFSPAKKRSLEQKVTSVISIGSLVISIFFLSSSLTGNVIGLNQTSSNWIGAGLFVIGLIGAFAFFKRR